MSSGTLLNLYSICVTDAIDSKNLYIRSAGLMEVYSQQRPNLVPFGTGTEAFVISQYNFVSGNQGVINITNGQ